LSALGFGPFQIGIVAKRSPAAVTPAIGFVAPGRDLRNLLLVGALATVATGLAFQATEQFALILVIGTMNPSSGDIGLFVPLEHAMLAREAPDHDRTRILAHYSLIGCLSSAAGALAAAAPTALVSAGVSSIGALKATFYFYAALGLAAAGIYRYLPHAQPQQVASRPVALAPSKGIVYKLAALFSPALTGVLLTTSLTGLPLVVCGMLKIVYDLTLLFSFRHTKPPEELAAKTTP
jgi:hypothetical protein